MNFLKRIFNSSYVPEGRITDLDRDRARARWREITEQMKLGKPSNLQVAIIEADKAVDELLRTLYPGPEMMGERLKLARGKFKQWQTYDNLWYAHKVRNAIVHESNIDLPSHEAVAVLQKYGDALKELA